MSTSQTTGDGQNITVHSSHSHAHGFTGMTIASATTTANPTACDMQGHKIEEEFIAYSDGLLVAYCAVCSKRIAMWEIPAGDIPARARGLISDLMVEDEVSHSSMALLRKIESDVAKHQQALDESRELLKIATAIMLSK